MESIAVHNFLQFGVRKTQNQTNRQTPWKKSFIQGQKEFSRIIFSTLINTHNIRSIVCILKSSGGRTQLKLQERLLTAPFSTKPEAKQPQRHGRGETRQGPGNPPAPPARGPHGRPAPGSPHTARTGERERARRDAVGGEKPSPPPSAEPGSRRWALAGTGPGAAPAGSLRHPAPLERGREGRAGSQVEHAAPLPRTQL